jgi:signal transduction histidine kinase
MGADGQSRKIGAAAAIALLVAGWGMLGLWLDGVHSQYRLGQARGQATVLAGSAAGALNNAVNQRLGLVRGLAAFVTVKLREDNARELTSEFPVFAAAIIGTAPGIRSVTACPRFVVRMVHPRDASNLKVIGNDLLADTRVGFADAVRRAVANRGLAVHEPVPLIQGGFGLIARHAVFDGDAVWGAVGMVFDLEPLLAETARSLEGYAWAVRTAAGTPVGGDQSVFDRDPVTMRIDLPDGWWDLAMLPPAGWASTIAAAPETPALRVALVLFGLILAVTAWNLLRRRRRLEALVEARTQALAAANAELESFAYAVAHDLQEPLRSIASYSQLVERSFGAGLGPQGGEWLDEVIVSAKRMKDLLRDVQVYLAENRLPLPTAAIPAADAFVAARGRLARRIDDTPGLTIACGRLPSVMADMHRLTEVFIVLLGNAIEYRSPDRPPEVRVSGRVDGGWASIEIADNGIGIEAVYLERIFHVFQRLHNRAAHPGTGMGLPIARKMVERLGGRIEVRSDPGIGSRFTVVLPV